MLGVRPLQLILWFVLLVVSLAGASYATDVQPRIIGGDEAKAGDHEYFVALVVKYSMKDDHSSNDYILSTNCGASLIDPSLVVTAAHCVTGKRSISLLVGNNSAYMGYGACDRFGCRLVSDKSQIGADESGIVAIDKSLENELVVIPATNIYIHPLYDPNSKKLSFDIALLRLPSPVSNATLKLPDQDYFSSHVLSKTKVTAIGHGDTIGGSNKILASPKLLQVDLTPRSDAECFLKYGAGFERSNMICAGDLDFDSCQGDSGGPLFDANGYLLGLVSFGPEDCGTQTYGVYADVFAFKSWIESGSWSNSPAQEELRFDTYTSADGEVVRMGAGRSGSELLWLTALLVSVRFWRKRYK